MFTFHNLVTRFVSWKQDVSHLRSAANSAINGRMSARVVASDDTMCRVHELAPKRVDAGNGLKTLPQQPDNRG